MIDLVASLVKPDVIVNLIRTIEKLIPGYWYSIYQQSNGHLELRGGPSLACEKSFDRRWAMTDAGDNGFRFTLQLDTPDIVNAVCVNLGFILNDAVGEMSSYPTDIPTQKGYARIQSDDHLDHLKDVYTHAIKVLKIAQRRGFDITELHLGSCSLSADSSIRGMWDGEEVDITTDLIDGGISDSLRESTATLLCDFTDQMVGETTADVPYSFGSEIHPGFGKIVEESGEALEVIGKIIVVGGGYVHWSGDLRQPLHNELADLSASIDFYIAQPENMDPDERRAFFERKMQKIAKFEDWHENPDPLPASQDEPEEITDAPLRKRNLLGMFFAWREAFKRLIRKD